MQGLQQYLYSFLCACMICAILKSVTKESCFQKQISLLCGIFLTTTLTAPLFHVSIPSFDDWMLSLHAASEAISDEGAQMTNDSLSQVIQEEVSAYIISKAREIGCELTPAIQVSTEFPPVIRNVTITGAIEEPQRRILENILEAELGIAKEQQIWMEPN